MEQSGDQEEKPQETGLSLGIDFGNSKISAAVWDPQKKAPSNVLFDGKYQFPATLYCTNIPKGNEGEGVGGDSNLDVKAKVGIDFDDQEIDNYENFVYDIKKLIGQRIDEEDNAKFENLKSNLKFKIELDAFKNVVCFDEKIPDSVVKEIAKRQPLRAVFRDSSFSGSPAKINIGEIFKMLAPDTRVKVI